MRREDPTFCFICHRLIPDIRCVPGEHFAHTECLDKIMHGPGINPEVRAEYDKVVHPSESGQKE